MKFWEVLQEEFKLNKETDFSFTHRYTGEGNWGDYRNYEIAVPTITSVKIPEKAIMHTIPISNIKRSVAQ
jgi:hypothetical protein